MGCAVTLGMCVYWQQVTRPSCLLNLLEHSLPCWGAWESRRLEQRPAGFLLQDPLHPHRPPSHWSCRLAGRWPSGHSCSPIPLGRKGSPAHPPASAFFAWIWSNFSSCAASAQGTPLFFAPVWWGGVPRTTNAQCAAGVASRGGGRP